MLEPLQPLTFDVHPCPVVPGEKGKLAWIKLAHLYIDPAYQRAILKSGKANVKRIVEQFSWERFGACVVSRRGPDCYAIIDGQHRATAALIHGHIESVPCVILNRCRQDEARAFNAINGNVTRVHPLQIFRAAVAGGDPDALRLVNACAQAGVTLARHNGTDLQAGETLALGALREALRNNGEEVLITALFVLRAADCQAPLPASAVRAICRLAAKHPEWTKDAARIGELLGRGGTIAQLTEKAITRKRQRGGPEWKNFADIAEMTISASQRSFVAPLSRLMAGR